MTGWRTLLANTQTLQRDEPPSRTGMSDEVPPDRLVIALDPPPLHLVVLAEAARHVRSRLEHPGLRRFVNTSGGEGLHVVVPLARRSSGTMRPPLPGSHRGARW